MERIALVGSFGKPKGFHYMLTLTAPGNAPHRPHPSAPLCPCWSGEATDLGKWNAGQSKCWNHLRTSIRRQYPGFEFMRAVETQKRGALHLHVLCWSPVPLSKTWLKEKAIAAGFGHSVDLASYEAGSRKAAYYIAKYVTKAADTRTDVPWAVDQVDMDTGEVTAVQVDGRYRTWSQSSEWGPTMGEARAACARSLAASRNGAMTLEDAVLYGVVVREPVLTHDFGENFSPPV